MEPDMPKYHGKISPLGDRDLDAPHCNQYVFQCLRRVFTPLTSCRNCASGLGTVDLNYPTRCTRFAEHSPGSLLYYTLAR